MAVDARRPTETAQ